MLQCIAYRLVGLFTPSSSTGERFERQSIGLTSLLSLAVILLILGEVMPKSAQQFPRIGASWYRVAHAHRFTRAGSFMLCQCALTFVASTAAALVMFMATSVEFEDVARARPHYKMLRKFDLMLLCVFFTASVLSTLPIAVAAIKTGW